MWAEIVSWDAEEIEGRKRRNEKMDGRLGRGERKSKIDGGGQDMRTSKAQKSPSTKVDVVREYGEVSGHLG